MSIWILKPLFKRDPNSLSPGGSSSSPGPWSGACHRQSPPAAPWENSFSFPIPIPLPWHFCTSWLWIPPPQEHEPAAPGPPQAVPSAAQSWDCTAPNASSCPQMEPLLRKLQQQLRFLCFPVFPEAWSRHQPEMLLQQHQDSAALWAFAKQEEFVFIFSTKGWLEIIQLPGGLDTCGTSLTSQ